MTSMHVINALQQDFGVVTGNSCPQRLDQKTRAMAARFLAGTIGASMQPAPWQEAQDGVPQEEREAWAAGIVQRIAAEAPLRILPGERLVGAATLSDARMHLLPGSKLRSVSHTTLDFEGLLQSGYAGLRQRIEKRLGDDNLDDKGRDLLKAMQTCIDAALHWNQRHREALEDRILGSRGEERRRYQESLRHLQQVPERPPRSFKEGLQALWSFWDFHRLCGNWSGIGRIDKMLGPLLEADLAAGAIDLDEARDWVAHFWIKGCEWILPNNGGHRGSGDAQSYQNIVLAGVDEDGREVCNSLTYLILDVVEELHISDFPIAVRINRHSPPALLERIAAVQQRGGGIVAIYNEELVIEALCRFGYDLREARNFANDGCWEVIIPGRTAFSYNPFDSLALLHAALGLRDERTLPTVESFEDVYALFKAELERHVATAHNEIDYFCTDAHAVPLVSLCCRGCIERGRGYYDRGADFTVRAIHAGGLPDCANSLNAIKQLVFDRRQLSLREVLDLLRNDWQDAEELRASLQQQLAFYGNDIPAADAMLTRVFDDFTAACELHRDRAGVLRPAGVSTFGRELGFAQDRGATAFGAKAGAVLATNMAATPGSDRQGPTALMRSFCSCDLRKVPNGVPLELKIDPSCAQGDSGRQVLAALMKTFIELGGFFLHIDVVDSALLREAQQHPERYPNLAVRISGWSARFASLNEDWQNLIIQRSQQRI